MPEAFSSRHGYALNPHLPALAGYVVGDNAQTDKFLYDYRANILGMLTSEHYGTIARRAKADRLSYFAKALEDQRPQLGDDLAIRANADVPAAAMWLFRPERQSKPTYIMDVKGAASVANIMGKKAVAVEAAIARLCALPNFIESQSAADADSQFGLVPDWQYTGDGTVRVLQRVTGDADIYFIVNTSAQSLSGQFTIRAAGDPELWDAATQAREALVSAKSEMGQSVDLFIPQGESRFVVVRRSGNKGPFLSAPIAVGDASGSWQALLNLPQSDQRRFTQKNLEWLDKNADDAIAHFSGVAHYTGRIEVQRPKACAAPRYFLSLEQFGNVSNVWVNGRNVGIAWGKGQTLDVTDAIRIGQNDLTV